MDEFYYTRTIESYIEKAQKTFPVLLVTGPRQVGKTTLLKHLSHSKRKYITLDDPQLAALAKEDPQLFLKRFPPPIFIDEIQYVPELLPFIKMRVDEDKKSNSYWLTGSQPFHLMKGVSESLAGRIGIINLLGLSLRELKKNSNYQSAFLPTDQVLSERKENYTPYSLQEIYEIIWKGSYPAIWQNDSHETEAIDKDLFYSSYIQTYLQRDVRDLAQVGDESAFTKFLKATASRSGQLLNLSDLARDTDISPNTAKRWLSILEASGIIYLLKPYHSNQTKRLVKTPKIYFLDTGLCSYLTNWTSPETLEAGAMSGAILETFIMVEILKNYQHLGKNLEFYFYRDKDQKEIDLLIIQDQKIYPLEFKKSTNPKRSVAKYLNSLHHLNYPVSSGGVICLVDQILPLSDNVNAIPIGML